MLIPHGRNRSALPAVFLEVINDPQAYKHLALLAWIYPSESEGVWMCQMASSCGQTRLPTARSLHHQHAEHCKMLLLLTIP